MPLDTVISSIWRFRGDKEASSVSYNATEMLANQAFLGHREGKKTIAFALLTSPEMPPDTGISSIGRFRGDKEASSLAKPEPPGNTLDLAVSWRSNGVFWAFFLAYCVPHQKGEKNKLVARRL